MVQPVNIALNVDVPRKKTPRVVEIIGPAGAGKTTIFQALRDYPERIRLIDFPNIRRPADAPFFIRHGLQLVPGLFRLYRRTSRQLSRREFAWITILKGWPSILQREIVKSPQVIVLDQGPVYLSVEISEFGPEYLRDEEAEKLWLKLYRQWAVTLDMIVWLDAADNLLMERIRIRNKDHILKESSSSNAIEFLGRYRRSFDYVLSRLKTNGGGPRVLRFDTGKQRPAEIVDRLLVEFGFP